MSVAFDTLSASEEFQKAGMSHDQAKVQVSTISKVLGSFATQGDIKESETNLGVKIEKTETLIKEVETKLEAQIKEVETKLEAQIKEVETKLEGKIKNVETQIKEVEVRLENKIDKLSLQLTIRLGAMMAMAVGLVAALVKFL